MIISTKEIKVGMKLSQDIQSKLGGIIYNKGTSLKEIDRDILKAFSIKEVNIEESEIKKKSSEIIKKKMDENSTDDLYNKLFNQALKVVDNIYKVAQGNAQIPIVDLRKVLYPLLEEPYQHLKYLSQLPYTSSNFSKYLSHHALSVGIISYAIGKWIGLDQGERMQLALAGVLHDVGMSRIPINYLYQTNVLEDKEFDEIKKHTLYGYQVIKDTKGLKEGTVLSVLQHHEREDGSGYPLQLKSTQIHTYSKIIAIADIFHAMISKRIYRSEYSMYQAIEEIIKEGFGKLDPKIVRVFVNKMTQVTNGTKVTLSNGKKGIIVFTDQQHPTRPWVKVDDKIINLVIEKNIYIKEIFVE